MGMGLALSAPLVVSLRPRCLGSHRGLCMSPGGGGVAMLETTLAQKSWGLPNMSHSRKALCKANMCSRAVINWIGREWGGYAPDD